MRVTNAAMIDPTQAAGAVTTLSSARNSSARCSVVQTRVNARRNRRTNRAPVSGASLRRARLLSRKSGRRRLGDRGRRRRV
jgi:hypothetical protein